MSNKSIPPVPGIFTSLPSTEEATLARDELLQRISNDANLPALGSSIARVVQLASSDDEAVRDLAYFVLADVALTQKILRLANTVSYRRVSGTPVTTISKAIFLLGFDMVKASALAMLLVDRMSGKRGQAVRTELTHALIASVMGRELARRSQFKDAEEAAVAALFKNIGKVLVAAHDHKRYGEIAALIDSGVPPARASMQILGCSFDMLAQAVLQEWNIPDTIIQALAALPSGILKPPKSRQEWMQQVTAFSTAAATLIPHMSEQADDAASKALLIRFGPALNLDQDMLGQLLTTVARESRLLTASARLPMPEFVVEEGAVSTLAATSGHDGMVENAAQQTAASDLPSEFLLTLTETATLQTDVRHPSGKPVNARDLLLAGVQDATEMMASGQCKINDLILLVLETLHRSMGFRFVTVCLKDVKSNQFRARISLGENNAVRQAGFVFPAESAHDLFHLAMDNDADLLISDADDPKIRNLVPAWHRALLANARSFIVLPLVVQEKAVGLFYADRAQSAPEGVPPEETALIKTLKRQVLGALNAR
ncbi:MAG TPA: HDOD domain-containing protein [Burkholderiaceae bacterium]|nr:HDOD domain-containing protein [Burkholderiaceae bacterium]